MSMLLVAAGAVWLGVLTSLSPCPLATNIAAVSYVARQAGSPRRALLASMAYTAGRSCAYLVVAAVVIASLLSMTAASYFLQHYMNLLLGPLLVLSAVFLLELLPLPSFGLALPAEQQARLAQFGEAGAFALGGVFALSFCPVSAALFFGSLIPLAAEHTSPILLPALYGVGTAAPVLVAGLAIALGARTIGPWLARIRPLELWARRATGAAFLLAGIYLTGVHIFGWSGG